MIRNLPYLIVVGAVGLLLGSPVVHGETGVFTATMDIGAYIIINDDGPIKVTNDYDSKDPFRTFTGCLETDVESNFNARLTPYAKAISAAEGDWEATITPFLIPAGNTPIKICVTGKNVQVQRLQGGQTDVPVAEITIEVIPISM